jgi:membrane associated rhomboid family serine protease
MINALNILEQAIDGIHAHIAFLFFWVFLAWGIHIINIFLNRGLMVLGIVPRHPLGLIGIITSPFIHADFNHLTQNSIFFLGLGGLVLTQGLNTFVIVSIGIMLLSGALLWLLGRKASHIGASSLIMGYGAYLVTRAIIAPGLIEILGALIGLYYFGVHLAASLLHIDGKVSMEGHFFGCIAGFLVGYDYVSWAGYVHTYGDFLLLGASSLDITLNQMKDAIFAQIS